MPPSNDANPRTPEKRDLPRIRTYAADMSRAIQSRGETLSSIVAAQQNATSRDTVPSEGGQRTRQVLFIAGGVLFLILSIVTVTTTLFLSRQEDERRALPQSIIFPNETSTLEVADNATTLLASERETSTLLLGEIKRLVLTSSGMVLSPSETARAIGIPPVLAREVTDIMVGIHSFNRTQPFVILSISAYDRSFNALLASEPELARSFGDFFAPSGWSGEAPLLTFTDAVLRNVDVRMSQDEYPVLYAFPARTLVVLTTNEFTLREVMTRLGSAQQDF